MKNTIKVFGLMALVASMSAASVMANEMKGAPHVEKRMENQKKRIARKLSKGKITQDEATQLNGKVDAIQAKEQTVGKKELNQELNQNSKEIKEAKKPTSGN